MSPPLRDVFSYITVGISSVDLRWDCTQGLRYRLTSLHVHGLHLPVPPTGWTKSYRMTHLVPAGLVRPLPQCLASGDLPVGEGLPSREAPVPEGLAVHPLVPHVPPLPEGLELPKEVASFSKYFPLSDSTPMVMNEVFFH